MHDGQNQDLLVAEAKVRTLVIEACKLREGWDFKNLGGQIEVAAVNVPVYARGIKFRSKNGIEFSTNLFPPNSHSNFDRSLMEVVLRRNEYLQHMQWCLRRADGLALKSCRLLDGMTLTEF